MLKLKGEVIGEFVNAPALPGTTFGWGPNGHAASSCSSTADGRLVLMDGQGRKQEVAGAKAVVVPRLVGRRGADRVPRKDRAQEVQR